MSWKRFLLPSIFASISLLLILLVRLIEVFSSGFWESVAAVFLAFVASPLTLISSYTGLSFEVCFLLGPFFWFGVTFLLQNFIIKTFRSLRPKDKK